MVAMNAGCNFIFAALQDSHQPRDIPSKSTDCSKLFFCRAENPNPIHHAAQNPSSLSLCSLRWTLLEWITLIGSFALLQGSYITLGSLKSGTDWRNVGIVAIVLLLAVGGQAIYKNISGARKQSLYQKTLEEVNKWKWDALSPVKFRMPRMGMRYLALPCAVQLCPSLACQVCLECISK